MLSNTATRMPEGKMAVPSPVRDLKMNGCTHLVFSCQIHWHSMSVNGIFYQILQWLYTSSWQNQHLVRHEKSSKSSVS